MDGIQFKLCDIQGRLFELSGAKGYDSATFIKAFMTSETAKGLDSKYNRLQWAGEEYLLAEVVDSAKLTPGGKVYDKETLFWSGTFIASGISPRARTAVKSISKPLPRP